MRLKKVYRTAYVDITLRPYAYVDLNSQTHRITLFFRDVNHNGHNYIAVHLPNKYGVCVYLSLALTLMYRLLVHV